MVYAVIIFVSVATLCCYYLIYFVSEIFVQFYSFSTNSFLLFKILFRIGLLLMLAVELEEIHICRKLC